MDLPKCLLSALCLLEAPALLAVEITSVEPPLVSTAGGTVVTFVGTGFTASDVIRLDQVALTNRGFVDAQHFRGTTPALAAGFHVADITDSRGQSLARLANAVEAASPPTVTSVDPGEVSTDGGTPVTVHGTNFRDVTVIQFGTHDLVNPRVADRIGTMITGEAPALGRGEVAGPHDVVAVDSRGRALLRNGVTYVAPTPPPAITQVAPSLVSTLGGTPVAVVGQGFMTSDSIQLDGAALTSQVFVDATRITGKTPALAAGFHEAQVKRSGAIVARLPGAVEAAPPSELSRVEPTEACSEGGTAVTISGSNLRRETLIKIGTHDLLNPRLLDPGTIAGEAPALDRGEALGPFDVTAQDSRGTAVLRRGITYKSCQAAEELPGPQELEASLAEGTARFSWYNPLPYQRILVMDEGGNLLKTLSGGTSFLQLNAPGLDHLTVQLKGVTQDNQATKVSRGIATKHQCKTPPIILGRFDPGYTADTKEFTLFGHHFNFTINRCLAPPMAPIDGGGAGEEAGGGGALNGFPQDKGTIGYVITQAQGAILPLPDRNKLTTGFVLEKDADRLEIAVYVEKLATAFDLELRGRLVHVFPADGFVDEFTFPDINIDAGLSLNPITYFRADKDIGHPGDPNDPDPKKQPPESCKVPIPAGEYLLDIYAVGGNAKLPYYRFIDDPDIGEILIPGAPCPPYPYVRVRDLTGIRTLPDIFGIEATPHPNMTCSPMGFKVTFKAVDGTWFDENNDEHQVPPDPPDDMSDVNPDFEYCWTIHDIDGGTTKVSHTTSEITACVSDWGCYKVDLMVTSKSCAFMKKRSYEVPVVPASAQCKGPYYTFLYPQPDPGGIYGIVGLNTIPPPGDGKFEGVRKVEFRVLVVPKCYCDGVGLANCPAAFTDDIDFRLVRQGGTELTGVQIKVIDLCPDTEKGAKYFHVRIDDIGTIPFQGALDPKGHDFSGVLLQGRSKKYGNVNVANKPDNLWQNIPDPPHSLMLTNFPSALDGGGQDGGVLWNGYFTEADSSYHFIVKTSPTTITEQSLGETKSVDILGVAEIPSYPDNKSSSGFTSRFMNQMSLWKAEDGDGTMDGHVLENQTKGKPLHVVGSELKVSGLGIGGGDGSGAGTGLPTYEWCTHETIFENHFSQTLFESVLYTGLIGPVPVTIWASIGLGLDFLVEAQLAVFAAPFAKVQSLIEGSPPSEQHFAEAHFYLCASVGIRVPCEVRADILGGIGNIAVRLVPQANLDLKTHIGIKDVSPDGPDFKITSFFSLVMEVEACLELLVGELCTPTISIPIVDHATIIDEGDAFDIKKCSSQSDEKICEGVSPQDGQGGGPIQTQPVYQTVIAPILIYSPEAKSQIAAYVDEEGQSTVKIGTFPNAQAVSLLDPNKVILDPVASFLSEDAAIVVWTRTYPEEAGVQLPPPGSPDKPFEYLPPRNKIASQLEIVISPATLDQFGSWQFKGPFRIADEETVPVDDRRADGRASIAADFPAQEAMVAWVRYEVPDYLIVDPDEPVKCARVKCAEGEICLCPSDSGGPDCPPAPPGKIFCGYKNQDFTNYRPHLERTAIYARRVNLTGGIGAKQRISGIGPQNIGINIEPSVALSPSGNVGYCVWVHDSFIDPMTGRPHSNLIQSNLGRIIKYSLYQKSSDSWSAPQELVAMPGDYPAMLEPFMALDGDGSNGLGQGIAAFTALRKGASEKDTGLGSGSRFVYICRLIDGVFGAPILVHGRCNDDVFGHWVQLSKDSLDLVDPLSKFHIPHPEWVMVFQGGGPIGLKAGSGNVMVSVLGQGMSEFTPPMSLTPDENIHSNVTGVVAGGMLHTLHLNGGPAKIGLGGGAGGANPKKFELMDTPLLPDASIVGCKLSDPFSAPGSSVTASVDIENAGLAGTPHDDAGKSAVGIRAVFISEDGSERVATSAEVPQLEPGEKTQVKLDLEMPHDPVRVRVELNPSPVDRDLTNNWRECFFGAPRPADFACKSIVLPDEEHRLAVILTWSNAALYDQLLLYRDGSMFKMLPGASSQFIDIYAAPGQHTYAIRSGILASRSSPATCALDLEPPPPSGALFIRGDANSSGRVDISDAAFTLNFLFLGGVEPPCSIAADSNNDGRINISDPSFTLNFLFLGGPEPPAPSPVPLTSPHCGGGTGPDTLPCEKPPVCP